MKSIKSSGLFADESNLRKNITKRAAACFPIFNLEKTDLKIIFQNYWKWKRNIDILYNAKVRNKDGLLIFELGVTKPKDQNFISCRNLLNENNINKQKTNFGTIEIEIISEDNIIFPFPAILAFYESNNGFISVLHSAGRTLEKSNPNYEKFEETNFYVSLDNKYKPFIHLFNGKDGLIKDLKVEIKSFNSKLDTLIFKIDKELKSFESEVLFLDKYIEIYKKRVLKPNNLLNNKSFATNELGIVVSGISKSIFPRFVCGNYDSENDHPFVTHTFRKIIDDKDLIYINDNKLVSTIALPRINDIDIKALIFPTTSSSKKSLNACFYDLDKKSLIKKFENLDISNMGKSFFIDKQSYGDSTYNVGLEIEPSVGQKENQIPARIPVSIRYSLNCADNLNPSLHTDIATQLRTPNARKKTNFWFQGYFKKNITNILFLSQLVPGIIKSEYKSNENLILNFSIQIEYHEPKVINLNYDKSELSIALDLNQFVKNLFNKQILEDDLLYSWRIEVIEGLIQDIYCVSYDKKSGIIFGEHSF